MDYESTVDWVREIFALRPQAAWEREDLFEGRNIRHRHLDDSGCVFSFRGYS